MSRRVNLPGADEIFRATGTPPGAEIQEPNPASSKPTRTSQSASGRAKHDEKMTVYLTSDELLALEQARLTLKKMLGRNIDRGRIVRAALGLALEDLEANGENSDLFGRLSD